MVGAIRFEEGQDGALEAYVNGLNKEKLLQLLEDIRKNNNITNADLCNKFADEIYLPKIVLKKADIPLSLRSQFIDLR